MSLELATKLREVFIDELGRQAEVSNGALQFRPGEDGVRIDGLVDLDALLMVLVGSLAGGP